MPAETNNQKPALVDQEAAMLALQSKQLASLRESGLLDKVLATMTEEHEAKSRIAQNHGMPAWRSQVPDIEHPGTQVFVTQANKPLKGMEGVDRAVTSLNFQTHEPAGGGYRIRNTPVQVAETVAGSTFPVGGHSVEHAEQVSALAAEVEQARDANIVPDVKDDLSGINLPNHIMAVRPKPDQPESQV